MSEKEEQERVALKTGAAVKAQAEIPRDVIFLDEHGYVRKCMAILKTVGNLRLKGETGCGKDTLVAYLAQTLKTRLYDIVLQKNTTSWDLVATDTLRAGETVVREGIIVKWLKDEAGILHLGEFNFAEQGIIGLIRSLTDDRRNIFIPELEQTFTRGPNHFIVISYNPASKVGYSGTFLENIATIRRFEGQDIEYLSPMAETKLIMKFYDDYEMCRKLVELASKTRELYKAGKLSTPITTGNLKNYSKLLHEGLDQSDVVDIARAMFQEEEQPTVLRAWEEAKEINVKEVLDEHSKRAKSRSSEQEEEEEDSLQEA